MIARSLLTWPSVSSTICRAWPARTGILRMADSGAWIAALIIIGLIVYFVWYKK